MSQRKVKEVVNAFDPEFLHQAERLEEPATAAEAELAGPWKVVATAGGYVVLREWETLEKGDKPWATFTDRELAERMVAVLPAIAAPAPWRMSPEADALGFVLLGPEGQALGYLRHSSSELLEALWVADHLVRSPRSLATLLMTAGAQALRHVGSLIAQKVRERAQCPTR